MDFGNIAVGSVPGSARVGLMKYEKLKAAEIRDDRAKMDPRGSAWAGVRKAASGGRVEPTEAQVKREEREKRVRAEKRREREKVKTRPDMRPGKGKRSPR
jgi:hypothetical protein